MARSGSGSGTEQVNVRQLIAIAVGLVALTWVVFAQTLRFPFITFDDEVYVYENRAVANGLSLAGLKWAFTHVVDANWHPLTILSHMLDCTLFGLSAGYHHFTNVLIHSAVVLLLFLLLRNMTGRTWRSAFVAAVFAIHPLRVESVAWVSERKDVLSGLFFVLTTAAYVRYTRSGKGLFYALTLVLYALGLMAKPMLVSIPFIFLLLDFWPLQRIRLTSRSASRSQKHEQSKVPLRQLVVEKIPLLLLAILSCVATLVAQRDAIAANQQLSLAARLPNAIIATAIYVRQLFVPTNLALLYPHPGHSLPLLQVVAFACFIALTTIAAIKWRNRYPYLLTGWFWFLIMLVPVIGIIQVGLQAHADRYTYLPHLGLCMALTWLVADWSREVAHRRMLLGAAATFVLGALALLSYQQTRYWRDTLVLWERTSAITTGNHVAEGAIAALYLKNGALSEAITHSQNELRIRPNSAEGHSRLGVAWFRQGRLDDALQEFRKVTKLEPTFPSIHYNLATALLEKGQFAQAIEEYRKELVNPEKEDENDLSRRIGGAQHRDEALLHSNFGTALARAGQVDEALDQFRQALAVNPRYPKVHYNIGTILLQRHDLEGAIATFQEELAIQPDYSPAHADLGVALSQKGEVRRALEEWRQALALEPDNVNALCNLGWVLSTHPDPAVRNSQEALPAAQRAVELSGGSNPRILRILAAAYAEAGQFEQAVEVTEKAERLASDQNSPDLVATLSNNLETFRAHHPLRD